MAFRRGYRKDEEMAIKVDLITGFLGAGKTTFIKEYAKYISKTGEKVGIVENDFSAVNVDAMLLSEIENDNITVEQIVGGQHACDWKRRFKAMLIGMAMRGIKHVIVEPSGIYNVDDYFDSLYDEPLDKWYEPGSVIVIVDAGLEEDLSKEERYLLASQLANAGAVVFSKADLVSREKLEDTKARLKGMLSEFNCKRQEFKFTFDRNSRFTDGELEIIKNSGYVACEHERLWLDNEDCFSSLFFLDLKLCKKEDEIAQLKEKLRRIFEAEDLGTIFRIKGFTETDDGKWIEINSTHDAIRTEKITSGQEVIIVIGRNLVKEKIEELLKA